MRKTKRLTALLLTVFMIVSIIAPMTLTASAAISTSTYNTKVQEFINDSRWKNGLSWGYYQEPKLSTYSSIGCCAYVADFAAYVYGSKTYAWNTSSFTKFYDLNEIRAGDIIHTSNHWFVVLSRTGNNFYTAEGNFDDKTRVTTSGWGIKNGQIYNLAANSARTFEYGFHYNFSNQSYTFSYNANGGSGTIASSSVTYGGNHTIANCAFTRDEYDFAGYYYVQRSDGTWYVAGQGWFTESEIAANGYTKRQYAPGGVYTIDNSWTGGASTQFSYTFYAQWTPKVINKRTFNTKVYEFINDSRWKNGITWDSAQTPKLSSYSSMGGCAYAADFAAYVYGSKTSAWNTSRFTKFTDLNEIRVGDIIRTTNQWFVVISRSGDNFYTVEGNFNSATRVTTSGWGIQDGSIYNLAAGSARTFEYGYHYNFDDTSNVLRMSEFNSKVEEFVNDPRWKNGLAWGDTQIPMLSSYSSYGCASYAADFAAYVYGSETSAWNTSNFTKFTDLNEIQAGDIIHITNHWFVVISRSDDTFYTVEGNFDDKTRVTTSGWGIQDGSIYNLAAGSARTFEYGYHYNFADAIQATTTISKNTFDTRVTEFINDSRWKNGTSWGNDQAPKLSTYSSVGACSLAADFAAYVYGSATNAWNTSDFTKFTDLNEIRAGDIIHTTNHWFIVISRTGDSFYTVEGDFDDKTRVTTSGWAIKDGSINNLLASSGARTFEYGFHYNFLDLVYSFLYYGNGGSGSMADSTVSYGNSHIIAANAFTREGYDFAGYYYVQRNDGKWYCEGSTSGWFTESEITANGYTKKEYVPGTSYVINNHWTSGADTLFNFTFYAQWTPKTYNILTYENYSAKNYMKDGGFLEELDTYFWNSRDTSVATVSVDTSVKHVSEYNTLKIVNSSAGASSGSKDLTFMSTTNGSATSQSEKGDSKEMILSFWAKSSKAGSKMYFRWGLESTANYRSVTLTTDWAYYTVKMDKTVDFGRAIHPYVDSVGTVWISEIQLEDGTAATEFVNDTCVYEQTVVTYGETYSDLPVPEREGYTFNGWYTEKAGGGQITEDTSVLPYGMALYANWTKDSEEYDSLTFGTNYANISSEGEMKYYTFTPDTTKSYLMYSKGDEDTKIYVYDEDGNEIASDDDSGADYNFRLEYELEAGKTYTFAVSYLDSSTGTITFFFGERDYLKNDVNLDGKVNMFDYVVVKSTYFKSNATDDEKTDADVNGDGKLNMFDYVAVKSACLSN